LKKNQIQKAGDGRTTWYSARLARPAGSARVSRQEALEVRRRPPLLAGLPSTQSHAYAFPHVVGGIEARRDLDSRAPPEPELLARALVAEAGHDDVETGGIL